MKLFKINNFQKHIFEIRFWGILDWNRVGETGHNRVVKNNPGRQEPQLWRLSDHAQNMPFHFISSAQHFEIAPSNSIIITIATNNHWLTYYSQS